MPFVGNPNGMPGQRRRPGLAVLEPDEPAQLGMIEQPVADMELFQIGLPALAHAVRPAFLIDATIQ